ncbi:MAG: glycoside hydrolase family 3 C-terminal domain-containing protein [Opitutaceae bacterium]|nr:glycoside hydrolase family 3 C-terminal domain-containing protein [Opitutaceae bacterium]
MRIDVLQPLSLPSMNTDASSLSRKASREIPAAAVATAAPPAEADPLIETLLKKLSLEQKIDLIGGEDWMYIKTIPEIGLPRLKMADGPLGVRTWGLATAYAGGMALAATWDVALAERVGVSLGRDARARGVNILLGPGVNIYRAPMNGRNFEYFGEDPFLASRMAVAYIEGVQSQDVIATVKHFAANNSEFDRRNVDSIIDERTLREIYLPPFEAAVQEGRVGAVMNSYNRINGTHATQNAFLNLRVLKREWGFCGILMSDWEATHDGVAAANNGLDLEMPEGLFMNRATLLPAVHSGRVSVDTIDDKVRRILRTAIEFHFFDRDQLDPATPLYDQKSRQVALESARESVVLLKNEGGLLPLHPARTRQIAVIGPNAHPAVLGGGGSSRVTAFAPVSLLTGISDALGPRARVTYSAGIKTFSEIFRSSPWFVDPDGQQSGLRQETFRGKTFTGASTERMIAHLDFWEGRRPGHPPNAKSAIRFSGFFIPRKSGPHVFVAAGIDLDSYRLYVDGRQIIEQRKPARDGRQSPQFVEVRLKTGKAVSVRFDYAPMTAFPTVGLGVIASDQIVEPEVRTLVAAADVAVISVGFDSRTETEACDRSYRLPFGQDELICAVLAANPRAIVVLNAGGGVDTGGWIDRVPAFLHAFYGGQESGRALADIIFGRINPSGRLPMSFERRIEDNPTFAHYYEAPGSTEVAYGEGVFLGYRHYDRARVKPLFPFGFGLSYTTFAFSKLTVSPAQTAADKPVTVSFNVKNTGSRAGAEIAQVYVGDPSAAVERPLRELKGFERVVLKPGETKRVRIMLGRRALAYWDVRTHAWRVDPGRFTVHVGASAADLPLHADFTVR